MTTNRICERCGRPCDDFDGHANYRDDGHGFCARCGRTRAWHAGTTCFCVHATGLPISLHWINGALDPWLGVRVEAHRARERRAIGVPLYLLALRVVRDVESILDVWRRELGADGSRAYELVTTSEQLTLEVPA